MDRCDASTLVIWACAVLAMASCNASGMAWSAVPATAHDGMVCHAGTPVCWVSAIVAIGSWVAASACASLAGRPLAMQPGEHALLDVGVAHAAGGAGERDHVQVRGHDARPGIGGEQLREGLALRRREGVHVNEG